MANRTLIILAASLFALTVLVRAPARWLLAAAPHEVICTLPQGSIWSGSCNQLRVSATELTDVSWTMHAVPLLLAHLDVDLRSGDARARGMARVSYRLGGAVRLRDVELDLPVDSGLLPLFPNGWSGQLQLALSQVDWGEGRLKAIRGTATVHALQQQIPLMPCGNFELRFAEAPAPDGAISGTLRDLGGPLSVAGTLLVRNGAEYELNGLVSTRSEATADLVKVIGFLPTDAQGRSTFSVAGTF